MSYDSVAETYERVAVPWFSSLAAELVRAVEPRRGDIVLDVGTGTGLAARTVLTSEASVTVVGVDPSYGMLATLPSDVPITRVNATVPGLPFPAASFDVAVANLSVSHMPDPAAGVADIARVIRPGGRFGCTAWAPQEDDRPGCPRADANRIVGEVRARLGLDMTPTGSAVPWEGWLQDPDHLRGLLTGAGLDRVRLTQHRAQWVFSVADFLSGWGSDARFRRDAAGEDRWRAFIDDATAALRSGIGDHIAVTDVAWVAVGHRAGQTCHAITVTDP